MAWMRSWSHPNAIHGIEWDNDETMRLKRCVVKAYVWNARTKTFDLSPALANRAKASLRGVAKEIARAALSLVTNGKSSFRGSMSDNA